MYKCNMVAAVAVAVVCLVAAAYGAETRYTAEFMMSEDPKMPYGTVKGTMWYKFDDVTMTNSLRVAKLSWPANVWDAYVWSKNIHYQKCDTTCTAETYTSPPERMHHINTDTLIGADADNSNCDWYKRNAAEAVTQISVQRTDRTKVCAVRIGGTSPRLYRFTSFTAGATDAQLTVWQSWTGCPAPICKRVMDIVFVIDESGSMYRDWDTEKKWVADVISKFDVSPTATNVAVVGFYDSSRVIAPLNNNGQSVINTVLSARLTREMTCIGCGMRTALNILKNPLSGRAALNPSRVMITLTDGINNADGSGRYWGTAQQVFFKDSCTMVKTAVPPIQSVGIGVGGYNADQLNLIGSNIPGVQTVYKIPTWSQIDSLIKKLVDVTCSDLGTNNCGVNCKGFCACQSCKCPLCLVPNKCTESTCSAVTSGCSEPAKKVCDDGNACTQNKCNDATGCDFSTPTDCSTPFKCLDSTCYPSSGCAYSAKSCADTSKCTQDLCNNSTGCSNPPVVVPANTACKWYKCDPLYGIVSGDVDCDDHDVCTNDKCDPTKPIGKA